jgi:chromosome segregation protein
MEGGAYLDRQRSDRLQEQKTLVGEREQRGLSSMILATIVGEAEAAVAAARAELVQLAEAREARTGELNKARAETHALQGRLRELMERSHRAEVELTAVNSQREGLGRQWVDAVLSLADAEPVAAVEEGEEPPALTVQALQEAWVQGDAELTLQSYSDPEGEIGRMRRQIRSLGAVNPEAVEQFSEAQERYEFLSGQRADLEAAREQLQGAISEIDQSSRETFMRAFEEIARHFDTMFKKLFGGGTTELRLTDPTDVLETGIDVIVQPPGKKQQNLLLLSGGERALTAVAMLFALLTVRPSPFCVLDEVDAPLDESNVGRFINTLREFAGNTQFIVVTHNRGTMEGADTLYGVTMEERGVSKVLSVSLSDPVVAQVTEEAAGASR